MDIDLNSWVSAERIQPLNQEYSAEIIQPIFYQTQESCSPSSIFQQGFDSEASVPPTQRLVQENDNVIQTFANLNPTPPSLPTSTSKSNPNTYPCLLTQRTKDPQSHHNLSINSNPQPSTNSIRCKKYQKRK